MPAERYHMIRPVGFAAISPSPNPANQNRYIIVMRAKGDKTCLVPELNSKGLLGAVDLKDPGHYGGPKGLASYAAVLHTPYQVSIMGLYETLAAGGTYIIPSYSFLRSIAARCIEMRFIARWNSLEPEIEQLWEWYHADLREAFVYFDSWDHLAQLMNDPKTADMLKDKKAMGQKIMARIREESLSTFVAFDAKLNDTIATKIKKFSSMYDTKKIGYIDPYTLASELNATNHFHNVRLAPPPT
ncbi:hypothetical protein GPECTOR_342g82 [Gonium pectorale]|uniref:Uncharacterized protein n=1 Tax=Gonium pectorale TaxID=33097 RepID=A0A150FVL1_GONPE|nr:hypothetical protein GPECTOR_342g82 [Gonium pectorale]|eukprot:KXZ41651.1 hypothetical protein GPECTOR_342g82 [Gonium pectorale]